MKCDSHGEISRKLEMLHTYKDEIAAAKAAHNSEQMYHIMDEGEETAEEGDNFMKIYAGRTEIPSINTKLPSYEELAEQARKQENKPVRQQFAKDTITFSEEGLKSAREMRQYLNENGLNKSIDLLASREELNKQLHTKYMDYTMNFMSEMQEVINGERAKWGGQVEEGSFESSITLQAKAYQVVHDRIVEEFSREDRDITYVIDETTGERREETVEDRLAELDHAYELHATFVASSKKVMAQIKEIFGGVTLPEPPEAIEKKTKEAYMEAVSEKNLERFRENKGSFRMYMPDLSIGAYWQRILAEVWKG